MTNASAAHGKEKERGLSARQRRKRYYGRVPVVNACISRLLFAMLRLRRLERKLKNKLIGGRTVHCVTVNTEGSAAELHRFIAEGFCKLNIGGGRKNLDGYINIDFVRYDGVVRQVVANALDLRFVPDRSMTHIHSNQFVEHLKPSELESQLREYQRILRPPGIITIRCPNVLGVSYGFFHGHVPETFRERFITLGFPADEEFENPLDDWYVRDLFAYFHWVWGDVGNVTNQHLSLLTPTILRRTLEGAGFHVLEMSEPEAAQLVVAAEAAAWEPRK